MRAWIIALALAVAACNPAQTPNSGEGGAANAGSSGAAEAPDPERDAMVAALSVRASDALGIPVTFQVTTKRTEGEWGWLVAQPWTPEGAQIDWSATRYAEAARSGSLDGAGTTYALLRRQGDAWTVVDFAIGPTDTAYRDWPRRHGAPASLITP